MKTDLNPKREYSMKTSNILTRVKPYENRQHKTGSEGLFREENIPRQTKQTLYTPTGDEHVILFLCRMLD